MRPLRHLLTAAAVGMSLCPSAVAARLPGFSGPDPAILASEDATKKELERIQKLAPSRSPVLNQEALAEARASIGAYSEFPERIAELEKIQVDSVRTRTLDALSQLVAAIKGCQKSVITQNLLIIRRQLSQFNDLGFDGFSSLLATSSAISETEELAIAEVIQFLQLEPEKICAQYPDKASAESLRVY